MDLLANKVFSVYMDLFGLPYCAQVAWTYMIAILYSGCTDLYYFHFVLRPYGPIWLPFCAQVTLTYFACVNSQHRGFTLSPFGLWTLTIIFNIFSSGHMDLYDCHFVLRLHGPIWLAFCVQVTLTYIICILHSGQMDLFCMCELTAQRLYTYTIWTQTIIFNILCSGHMDLYDWHFCSGCMDLYDWHFVLRSHGPILHVWTHSTEA